MAFTLAIAGGSHASCDQSRAGEIPAKPNLVWIWADNLGYGDLACYGNRSIKTPRIDELAAEGARFTSHLVAHVVCSPSRAALITGRQPFRSSIVAVLRPDGPNGMPDDEITLAEALRDTGYATLAIGKWHLGDRAAYLPTRHGFDHYFGIPYSLDMAPTILFDDERTVDRLDGDKVQNVTERYTDEAIRFVRQNRERPFFIHFAHSLPHRPINLPAKDRTPGRPIYEDAVETIDREVGRLVDTIDELGLAERTLIIFSSDNGPQSRLGSSAPFRGGIGSAYEGGLRVPMLARFRGVVPTGLVVDEPTIMYDIFPTFVRLAGGKMASDRVYDGQDIWPLFTGGEIDREHPFFWVHTDKVSAVRDGKWKLHVAKGDAPLAVPELYDLSKDVGERLPVTDQPEIVERLAAAAREFEATIPKAWTLIYTVRDPEKLPSGVRKE